VEKKRKRKLETCAILTSSPYKLQLAEKQQTGSGPVKNKNKAVSQADEDSHAVCEEH